MPKLRVTTFFDSDEIYGYTFKCPGCGMHHMPAVASKDGGPTWTFNGDLERPTFSPSLLSRWRYGDEPADRVCHSFITDGNIQFLGDCTHALANQTVELPEVAA